MYPSDIRDILIPYDTLSFCECEMLANAFVVMRGKIN